MSPQAEWPTDLRAQSASSYLVLVGLGKTGLSTVRHSASSDEPTLVFARRRLNLEITGDRKMV